MLCVEEEGELSRRAEAVLIINHIYNISWEPRGVTNTHSIRDYDFLCIFFPSVCFFFFSFFGYMSTFDA